MKIYTRKVLLGISFLVLALYLLMSMYVSAPIEIKVVDAATRQPIEGVVAVANWEIEQGTPGGNVPTGQLWVMESVSKKNGSIVFPRRGPSFVLFGRLSSHDPQIILFKSRYRYLKIFNDPGFNSGKILRRSRWHGSNVELVGFEGNLDQEIDHFKKLNRDLDHIILEYPSGCFWKDVPETILSVNREKGRLVKLGADKNTLATIDQNLLINAEYFSEGINCTSPVKYFGD